MTALVIAAAAIVAALCSALAYHLGLRHGRNAGDGRANRAYEVGYVRGSFDATEAAIKARLDAMEAR